MPAPYSGETLTCRVRATDPVTKAIITDAAGTAYFFAPPKNPQTTPADRSAPDHTVALTYDPVSRYYLANFATTGWPAGIWWCQATIVGGTASYNAWDYVSFEIQA